MYPDDVFSVSIENKMRIVLFALLLAIFAPPIFAQRLSITPTAVTILEGDSEHFTVVLSSEPTRDVTVTIVKHDGTEVSLDKTELIFTPENWNVQQTVRLVAAEDEDSMDNNGTLILIASGDDLVGDGITVSPDTTIIASLGETTQLMATVQDQDGETVSGIALEWSSLDPSVAVVDSSGKVTAVGFGETKITAKLATASGTATILVDETDHMISRDREILEMLFNATGGKGWPKRDGWLTDAPLGEWRGVRTNVKGRVTALKLGSNNLTGHIPSFLGKLDSLEELRLSQNSLTGSIPSELGNLAQLKVLSLTGNSLTGSIPSELGNLTQLEELFLYANSLTGSIPSELGNLAQLKVLNFSGNSLSGPIPSELGNLAQLEDLWLEINSLTGSIPPELGNLAQLKVLRFAQNSLTGSIPPELGNLAQLKVLHLGDNSLSGPIPSELGTLSRLEIMAIYKNKLAGPIPPELGNLAQLVEVYLGANSLTSIPSELGNLARLEIMDFGSNALTGPIPSELGNLTQLKKLFLYSSSLTGSISSELGNLAQLEVLHLADNSLSGPIPSELGSLAQLEELWLERNSLTGSIPPELGNLTQLKELRFGGNSLTGSIPSKLSGLVQLENLRLERNSLTGSIPSELGGLVQLEALRLERNSLTGSIPSELGNLLQLKSLRLFRNGLTGLIPPELSNITQLLDMNLGNNFLTGLIPSKLAKMVALQDLNLRNNQLSGFIPSELGNLQSLTILDLGNNTDLEGILPRSFLKLNLSYVDIRKTGICEQQDAGFLEWRSSISRYYAEECTPRQIERSALIELYKKTEGDSWRNATGWNSRDPLRDWHGVRIRNGRVTELSLSNNALTGSIPGEVANFTELKVLNLAGNALAGVMPEEILSLSGLTELRVNQNTDLEGVFGDDMARHLTQLEVLHFGGTLLCASPSSTFQTWYAELDDASGQICGNPAEIRLDIPVAYLTQSIQTPEHSVRLIEGRDALLRVFVTGEPAPAFFEHEVVATIRGGGRTHQVEMTRDGIQLLTMADESSLNNSFNAIIPGDLIRPDATLVVEADPAGVIPRAAGSRDRFPATGEEQLNVVSVPAMDITVVPVLEANQPDRSIFEWTDNISDNSSEVGLFKYAFPFHEFHARSRESYTTSLDLVSDEGRWGLVLELEALRLLDNATGYYYGAAASVNGFVRGIARRGGWTSMGKALDADFAHEVGHNLNLGHAPCGGADRADPDYPHPGGSVGAWGFDFRDSTLISPDYHKDIMGYCYEQGWISDYFYEKVIDFRERVEGRNRQPMAGAPASDDVLVLWGGMQGGELRMEPPFPATAPARLPNANGPYRLEGVGQQGEVMFLLSFTPGEDKFGNQYFFFAIPIEQDWEDSLERIVLTSPEQSVTIDASDQRRLSILRDSSTGHVRGILRDWDGDLPAALERADNLTVTTNRGFKESIRLRR